MKAYRSRQSEGERYDVDAYGNGYAQGYTDGKDKAYFELLAVAQFDSHSYDCGCRPCQVLRAARLKVNRAARQLGKGTLSRIPDREH